MDRSLMVPAVTGTAGAAIAVALGLSMKITLVFTATAAILAGLAGLSGCVGVIMARRAAKRECTEVAKNGLSSVLPAGSPAASLLPVLTKIQTFRNKLSYRISDLALTSEVLESTFDYFVTVTITLIKDIVTIRDSMDEQKEAVQNTSSSVVEMISSVDSITANTEDQAVAIDQLSSTIEEMTASIKNIADISKKAADVTHGLMTKAEDGGKAVESSVEQIKKVKNFSEKITEINSVITDISQRTNLLAMNAAIEAAHAGEAGRGFAVVSDEIRKLAENSNESAHQIEGLVRNIISAINDSSATGNLALQQYKEIVEDVRRTRSIVEEVTSATEEQSRGITEILDATSSLVSVTEQIKGALREQKSANADVSTIIGKLEKTAQDVQSITGRIDGGRFRMMDAVNRLGKVSVRNYALAESIRRDQ